ncbi:MAG TPA: hypothetical protein VNG53_01725, partial [Bacteroidia bacterium]|nr:hypothetical protein [Bacteroidia bacterium]
METIYGEEISKIHGLLQSAQKMLTGNPSEAGTLVDEALALAYEAQYREGIAESLLLKSDIFFTEKYYEQAAAAAFQALDIYLKLEDQENRAICYQKLGNSYHKIGSENDALEYYLEVLKFYKKKND